MRVIKNKPLNLSTPKFLVDGPLNPELEKIPVFSHLNRYSCNAFVGTSGSGKTSLLISLLKNKKPKIFRKMYNHVIVVMPRASRNSLKHNLFDKHLPEECLFDSLDEQSIHDISVMIQENASEGQDTLLIMDDVGSALKDGGVVRELQHLIYAYRHFRVNICILTQTLKTLPLSIRKNLSNLVVFHLPKNLEWNAMTEEFLEMDKDKSMELRKFLFDEKHTWALINLSSGKIYKKYDEVIYKDDD